MDVLKAEMERKRKALEEVGGGAGGKKKYVKRADLEAMHEKAYLTEQLATEDKKAKKLEEKLQRIGARGPMAHADPASTADASSHSQRTGSKQRGGEEPDGSSASSAHQAAPNPAANGTAPDAGALPPGPQPEVAAATTSTISAKEVIRRLRKRGEPIRLFGESDEERVGRLRRLEALAGDAMDGQRNDFMAHLNELDRELDIETLKRKAEKESGLGERPDKEQATTTEMLLEQVPITLELFKKSKDRVYMAIHDYFQSLLRDWERELDARSEEVKRSRQGKSDLAFQQQSADYLQPLFALLQKKQLPDDILVNIVKISQDMQERDYVQANNTYYLLSIGNAPWPIGVTMVGIHERSAREKISSNQVAHVLNDEKTRKWIQSMKRLMTFCQQRYPPADLAKTIGWVRD